MGILSRIRKGGSMSKCQLCSKEVDEREIQEQIGFSLCLSCDCKYNDQELIEIIKEKNYE